MDQPKTHLYRLIHSGKPAYLGTHLTYLLDQTLVAATHGGGEYLFVVIYRDRILRKGIWLIEGNPI